MEKSNNFHNTAVGHRPRLATTNANKSITWLEPFGHMAVHKIISSALLQTVRHWVSNKVIIVWLVLKRKHKSLSSYQLNFNFVTRFQCKTLYYSHNFLYFLISYTSLGDTLNTIPNPHLKITKSLTNEIDYKPAWQLENADEFERAGRISK